MKPCFFVFGFGYTAKVLAPELIKSGFSVVGTSRLGSLSQVPSNSSATIVSFSDPNLEQYLAQCTHLLITIPPDKSVGDIVLSTYAELINQHASHIKWVSYLSSTGVYGDHQGDWVNEESACNPVGKSGIARLEAEQAWFKFAKKNDLSLHVFRLAGIYGSQRNALERLLTEKKQYSICKKGHVFSRIHVEDIVVLLMASMHSPKPMSIYNASDNEPAASHIVDQYAASLLGIEPLPVVDFHDAALSPMESEFYANNRRVSNTKIKDELNFSLKFPTYREGLGQIWRDEIASK